MSKQELELGNYDFISKISNSVMGYIFGKVYSALVKFMEVYPK